MLYMDGKDTNGKMMHWTMEMGSPSALTAAGWNQKTLKPGDQVTVDAWLSRSRDDHANVKSIKLSDGRELAGGSSLLNMKTKKQPKKAPAN